MGYSTNNEKEISFKVSVSNQFTDNRYEITFLLTSWNAGVKINSDVRLKENVNDTTNDIKIINQGYNEFSFDPNRFFNGSVISYDLGCLECKLFFFKLFYFFGFAITIKENKKIS